MDPLSLILYFSFLIIIIITQIGMLYQKQLSQIVEQLLDGKPKIILEQNDEMLLTWNKAQLFRRWPQCMIPTANKKQSPDYIFTGMLGNVKNKAYQYENVTKPVLFHFNEMNSKLKTEKQEQIQRPEGEQFKLVMTEGQMAMKPSQAQKQQDLANVHDSQKGSKMLNKSSIKSVGGQQKFSPFLPNYQNHNDRNVNANAIRHKFQNIKINSKTRNIAALIEQQTKVTDKLEQMKFGKSVPKRTADNIDISDILKYTLGAKREKQSGVQPESIRNPFIRVPPKFYQSLGDFYTNKK